MAQREILFRGKRVDDGGWVYGNYVEKIKPTEKEPIFWCCFIQDGAISMYEVVPETVGQYTGLKDINGHKIFEGDILRMSETTSDNALHHWIDEAAFVCGGFATVNRKCCDACARLDGCTESLEEAICMHNAEAIGNIHDNPELL